MRPMQVYYSTYARFLTMCTAALSVFSVIITMITQGFAMAWHVGILMTTFTFGVWLVMWRPRVELHDTHLSIVNVTKSVQIPWSGVTDIKVRWALEIDSFWGTTQAWAMPRNTTRMLQRQSAEHGTDQALEDLQDYLTSGSWKNVESTEYRVAWNVRALLLGTILVSLTAVTWLI